MPTTQTNNMQLNLPNVTQEPGPQWATDINSSLTQVDQHDHSVTKGVPVTQAGLNLTGDLPLNTNNLLSTRTTRYANLGATASSGTDTNCTYVSSGNLYYNDNNGNQIQLTQSGKIVAASSGQIQNLVPPAGVYYVATSGAFVFSSSGNPTTGAITFAQLNVGNVISNGNLVASAIGTSATTMVWGNIGTSGSVILQGQGFTTRRDATGNYTIIFNVPFGGPPSFTACSTNPGALPILNTNGASTTGCNILFATAVGGSLIDINFSFQAIGFV